MRTQKPPIGTPMWHVLEHLYYEKTRAGPLRRPTRARRPMWSSTTAARSTALGNWQLWYAKAELARLRIREAVRTEEEHEAENEI